MIFPSKPVGQRFIERICCNAFLVIVSAIWLGGCAAQSSGVALSKSGMATADALKQYYTTLAQQMADIPELENVHRALLNQPGIDQLTPAEESKYAGRVAALQRRAAMCQHLSDLYAALGNLSSYDSATAVSNAAGGLSDAVKGLPNVKEDVDPKDLVAMISSDLATIQQSSDIMKASKSIGKATDGVFAIFEREKSAGAYQFVTSQRSDLVRQVSTDLMATNNIDPTAIMKSMGDAMTIPWTGDVKANDPVMEKAAAAVVAANANQVARLADSAADDIERSLKALQAANVNFATSQGINLSNAMLFIDRAQAYLDEIDKLRSQSTQSKKKSPATAPATTAPVATP